MAYANSAKSYAKNELHSQVNERSSEELISLLFDRASVLSARMLSLHDHTQRESYVESVNGLVKIVLGLRSILDMEKGGNVSEALYTSYSAIASCAFKQIRNPNKTDIEKLSFAVEELRQAWKSCIEAA